LKTAPRNCKYFSKNRTGAAGPAAAERLKISGKAAEKAPEVIIFIRPRYFEMKDSGKNASLNQNSMYTTDCHMTMGQPGREYTGRSFLSSTIQLNTAYCRPHAFFSSKTTTK
jgi:hypothetical protein